MAQLVFISTEFKAGTGPECPLIFFINLTQKP